MWFQSWIKAGRICFVLDKENKNFIIAACLNKKKKGKEKMKRKSVEFLLACCCFGMILGCGQPGGAQSKKESVGQQTVQVEQNEKKDENKKDEKEVKAEKKNENKKKNKKVKKKETASVSKNDVNEKAKTHTITGTISEKKDFMFVIEDDKKNTNTLAFSNKPAGYDDLKVGDSVTVEYTGELSEAEAFTGEVLSIKKEKKE